MGCAASKGDAVEEGQRKESLSQSALQRKRSLNNTDLLAVRLTEKVSLDFDRVLADSDGHAAILKFAGEELSDENIKFWTAVRDFKVLGGVPEMQAMLGDAGKTSDRESPRASRTDSAAVDHDKLKEAADSIIKTYLMEGAELAITVSGKLAAQFAKRPKAGVYDWMYSVTMFDQVHKAVRALPTTAFSLTRQPCATKVAQSVASSMLHLMARAAVGGRCTKTSRMTPSRGSGSATGPRSCCARSQCSLFQTLQNHSATTRFRKSSEKS